MQAVHVCRTDEMNGLSAEKLWNEICGRVKDESGEKSSQTQSARDAHSGP